MRDPFLFKATARLLDFMRQADQPGLINLAAGIPGLDALPAEALGAAFRQAMSGEGARLFGYHHPEGDHRLREILAERLNQRGTLLGGTQLLMTTGCTQALSLMISIIVRPGDVVACEAPAYYGMLELLSQAGARILPLPLAGDDGIDLDFAAETFQRFKPRCLIVCSSLSNPSGATLPQSKRARLVELCRESGVRIIEDDIYGELVDGGHSKPMLAYDDGSTVSYVTSFSKSVSPGLRVGFCVPGTLFEEAAARKCQQDLHSAVPTEVALREFLLAGEMEPHLEQLRIRNARRRELGIAAVERNFPSGTLLSHPIGGYMLWAGLPQTVDLGSVRSAAHAEGVAFASGDVFFAGAAPRSAMRLNCAHAGEEDLVKGIEILGRILAQKG